MSQRGITYDTHHTHGYLDGQFGSQRQDIPCVEHGRQKRPFDPPKLTINLSTAPEHRYDQVSAYTNQR